MKKTEFTYKIPDLIKQQIKDGIGSIDITYFPKEYVINGYSQVKVEKHIIIKLSVSEFNLTGHMSINDETFEYSSDEDGEDFETWFNKIRKENRIYGDKESELDEVNLRS